MRTHVWFIEWRYRDSRKHPRGWHVYLNAYRTKIEAVESAKEHSANWHLDKHWRVVRFVRSQSVGSR